MKDFLLHPDKREEEQLLESFFDQSNAFLHTDPAVGVVEEVADGIPLFDSEVFEALSAEKPPYNPNKEDDSKPTKAVDSDQKTTTPPAPDVAQTPASKPPVPTPYPNMASSTSQEKAAQKVKQDKSIKAKEDFEERKKMLEPLYEEKKQAIKLARQEYATFKKSADIAARQKNARLQVRMRFKAFERVIDKEGLTFGTAAFVAAFSEYFPGNSLNITVTDGLEARLKEAKTTTTTDTTTPVSHEEQKEKNITEKDSLPDAKVTNKDESSALETNSNQPSQEPRPATSSPSTGGSSGDSGGAAGSVSQESVDKSSTDGYAKSLGEVGPVQFVEEMKGAKETTSGLQQTENEDLKADLPKVEQPTGLPTKEGKKPEPEGKKPVEAPKEAQQHQPKGPLDKAPAPTPHDAGGEKPAMPSTPAPKPIAKEGEEPASGEGLVVKSAINTLPSSDSGVNTDFGPKPPIELKGQADPHQNEEFKTDADKQSQEEKTKADAEIGKDFGENDAFPTLETELLEAKTELTPPPESGATDLEDIGDIPEEVKAGFDKEALEKLNTERSAEIAKADEAKTAMDSDMKKEREQTDKKIEEETAKTKKEQEQAQKDAKGEVDKQRKDWESENKQAVGDYESQAAKEKGKVEGEISSKVKKADADIDKKITDADSDVKKEQQQAEKKAAAEKEKEKQKPKGFWDSLCDAVTSFFDAIKKAVNAIFDALRALVKTIIEAAKKAVNALIDAVKDAVKNMIKAFGEILKGLVTVLLAAFPGIRDKFLKLIDKAVDAACKLVDKLAEGLKKLANALLDALGAVLDAILAAYQKAINLLVDALAFIAVGLIKIMKGIANLVKAAKEMPSHFWGQVSEEMLGVDITKPLPNEAPMPADQSNFADQLMDAGDISTAEKQVIQKPTMEESDVHVDAATDFQLDPVLMQQLAAMGDGEGMSFDTGEGGEEEVEKMKQEALTGQPQEQATSGAETASPATSAPTQAAGPGMVGPFSGPGERLAYLAGQMKEGITKWWNDNKVAIIAGLVLGIAGVILANVLTGGAIMAALPLLMQIIGALFAAQAIANATGYFGSFLSQGFQGNIGAGAVALARATAIIVVELVTTLLFAGKGAVKGAKAAVKTVAKQGVKGALKTGAKGAKKAAIGAVKSNIKAVKDLGKVAKAGGKAALKNGKLALTGIKNGFGRGTKSFGALAKKFANKFKLKSLEIRIKKKRFYIYGEFNPKLLLASGEIEELTPEQASKLRKQGGNTQVIGKSIDDGVVISDDVAEALKLGKSKHSADEILKMSPEDIRGLSASKAIDYDEIARLHGDHIAETIKKRGNLAGTLGKKPSIHHQAHHIIPVELATKNDIVKKAIEQGFDFNGKINGKWVKQFSSKSDDLLDGVHASHPNYTKAIEEYLDNLQEMRGFDINNSKTYLEKVVKKINQTIDANPGTKLDVLSLF